MHGAFDASDECDHDPLATAEEINRSGEALLEWIESVVGSPTPGTVQPALIDEIHRRWFETTFPADAGRQRTEMVLNRKQTAAAVEGILPALDHACASWRWRRENVAPADEADLVAFIVAEANSLAVGVYDAHPYVDGNTRTTWHLRNYVLMLDGLRPLIDLDDEDAYQGAWWSATPQEHDELDRIVLLELDRQDR